MTYRITRNDGTFYAAVPSNIILGPNNPTANRAPINLIGRNKVSYGEAQNENFLWLTENFAGENEPTAPVKGQLWYDTGSLGTDNAGQLRLAIADNASGDQWATVPLISQTSTEPVDGNTPGRMIIQNGQTLKIRMNNSWYTILTEIPEEKYFNGFVGGYEQTNNSGIEVIPVFPTGSNEIGRFNEGAYLDRGTDNLPFINGYTKGVLRYGGVYQWSAKVVGRYVNDTVSYKAWDLKGTFHVPQEGSQVGNPDPRRIVIDSFESDVLHQSSNTSAWTVGVRASQDAPPAGTTLDEQLNGPYYGMVFDVNLNDGSAGANAPAREMEWTIYIDIISVASGVQP